MKIKFAGWTFVSSQKWVEICVGLFLEKSKKVFQIEYRADFIMILSNYPTNLLEICKDPETLQDITDAS